MRRRCVRASPTVLLGYTRDEILDWKKRSALKARASIPYRRTTAGMTGFKDLGISDGHLTTLSKAWKLDGEKLSFENHLFLKVR